MTNTIAIIAAGTIGSAIARRMAENGARVLTRSMDAARRPWTAHTGRDDLGERRWDRRACGICVVGRAARRGARFSRASTPVFERQSRRPVFMDCNAVNPSALDRIRAVIGQDEHFLDACIIGSPPKPRGISPALYVCGPSSTQAISLRDLGLDVRLLPGPLGRASGLKMCSLPRGGHGACGPKRGSGRRACR
jgi:3-hydroxyisobutyrate dehydrogenase-like beta-hydroxyacid dehydrogenase